MKQHVAVVGLGRFGSAVAVELVHLGHEVLGIDSNMAIVQALSNEMTHVVQGDVTDEESMRRLGLAEFDAAVVGITDDLETSILATLLLKRLGIPRVVVKARNATHGEILERVGADRVVYPEHDTGLRVAHSWTSTSITDSLDVIEGYSISRVTVPSSIVGKTVAQTIVNRDYNVTLLLIARGDRVTVYPAASEVLRRGDILVMAGAIADMERFFSSISE